MNNSSGSGTSSSLATLDCTILKSLSTLLGDVPFLVKVVGCYLAETPEHLQAMRTAIGQRDRVTLHNAAHALKSNSAMVGAIALASLCANLEVMSQSTPTTMAETLALFTCLEAEYERVQVALTQEVKIAQHQD